MKQEITASTCQESVQMYEKAEQEAEEKRVYLTCKLNDSIDFILKQCEHLASEGYTYQVLYGALKWKYVKEVTRRGFRYLAINQVQLDAPAWKRFRLQWVIAWGERPADYIDCKEFDSEEEYTDFIYKLASARLGNSSIPDVGTEATKALKGFNKYLDKFDKYIRKVFG